jgi:hypothetical protein
MEIVAVSSRSFLDRVPVHVITSGMAWTTRVLRRLAPQAAMAGGCSFNVGTLSDGPSAHDSEVECPCPLISREYAAEPKANESGLGALELEFHRKYTANFNRKEARSVNRVLLRSNIV